MSHRLCNYFLVADKKYYLCMSKVDKLIEKLKSKPKDFIPIMYSI